MCPLRDSYRDSSVHSTPIQRLIDLRKSRKKEFKAQTSPYIIKAIMRVVAVIDVSDDL